MTNTAPTPAGDAGAPHAALRTERDQLKRENDELRQTLASMADMLRSLANWGVQPLRCSQQKGPVDAADA